MLKNILSILLIIIFANFIVAPTIISLLNKADNVSLAYDLNEEEKTESLEVKEIELANCIDREIINCDLGKESISTYFLKNYDSFCIQLPLPPPEQNRI